MSFANAPVTKGMMLGLGATSLLSALFAIKPYFHLQLIPHMSRHHQYWRLISHHLACTNSSELFITQLILYNSSVIIERQFGSVKYASFITVSAVVSSTISFICLLALQRFGLNYIPAGPISILFSILYQYHRLVPSAYTFQISVLKASNKYFLYVLGLQVIISQMPGSVVAACVGILAGQVYRADMLGFKSYRLPLVIQRLGHFLTPLIGSTRPQRRSNQAMPDETTHQLLETLEAITTARPRTGGRASDEGSTGDTVPAAGQGAASTNASVMSQWVNELTGNASGIRVPTEAETTQVASMFPDLPRQSVVLALQRSPNIETAVETLLGSAR
ncbi:hypothetical protein BU17DRAFT_76978 [Hysterangium stoloniferum]|nr:hypothetical protein BU17DRAFT_76978 [Hysterangium stoloniferum]